MFLEKNKKILDVKLWAIADGLKIAKATLNDHIMPVTVFNDSQEALTAIWKSSFYAKRLYLRNLIYQRTLNLENSGHPVTIRWIPCHVGLVGHDKADQSAKDKARKGGKPVEQCSSLTHIKKLLDESHLQEVTRWHEIKT